MKNQALVVIDLQNDITKNYREIIDTTNQAIDWAVSNNITEFFIAGADATACVKSTCYNMSKAGYAVHVLSDCITSYDKKKLPEMLEYYASKGCTVDKLSEIM